MSASKSAIVIGAGIVGMATARALANKGYTVKVFERNPQCVGASIRNFGMVWPIGQPNGEYYERALRSKSIWKSVATNANIWHNEVGSLHVAHTALEAEVLQQLVAIEANNRPFKWLTPSEAIALSPGVNPTNLQGALFCSDEMIIESRVAIHQTALYLQETFPIEFIFNTAISRIENTTVYSGSKSWQADIIFVCSGSDFETLLPKVYNEQFITKCKLQMMRIVAQPDGWRIGPSLCGGLSLIHYKGFAAAPSLQKLKAHYEQTMADYLKWGIHVMVSQNGGGELTIGDSHEYGLHLDPFDKAFINNMILDYMKQIAQFKDWTIAQNWNGTYPKLTNGDNYFYEAVHSNLHVINGLGGNGMTLSFAVAEDVVNSIV